MSIDEFRQAALGLPGTSESAHMGHPDFRVGGKIFATIGYPDESWGMVALTPEQQQAFVKESPRVFRPCKGVWGERGATNVRLATVRQKMLEAALDAAWKNIAGKAKKRTKRNALLD